MAGRGARRRERIDRGQAERWRECQRLLRRGVMITKRRPGDTSVRAALMAREVPMLRQPRCLAAAVFHHDIPHPRQRTFCKI